MPQVDDRDRNSDDGTGKVWEQIGEILEKEERAAPEKIQIAKPTAPRRARSSGLPIWYPTPEKLIALGIGLMVLAVILRQAVLPLTLGGFVLAGIGYYMIVMRKRRAKWGAPTGRRSDDTVQYWRGRPVNRSAPPASAKKRDGNIIEFPGAGDKNRRRFGRKR